MTEIAEKRPRKERKENANRRRRQLLDAARRSILQFGLAKTTLATVSKEAGLSQGVAVFYFESKGGLLRETLRDLYTTYERLWQSADVEAGNDPVARLLALLQADFDAEACGPDVLPVWFAFWGELRFQQDYDAVAEGFDSRRHTTICDILQDLLPEATAKEVDQTAEWIEALSDGYWQRLHLAPGHYDRSSAFEDCKAALRRLLPDGVLDW
ncbi:MAG: TetR family transcriptional regulator C-terminal domain-containing protein [Pseudomonadota bacterium]